MHSSLPPSSPPVSRRSSPTLRHSPVVTPSRHSLPPSSRPILSSLPPPYSAAGTSKAGMRIPASVTRSPMPNSPRPGRSSAYRPSSTTTTTGGSEQSGVQLDGHDVHFTLVDHKLHWKKVPRMSRAEFEAKLGTDTPAARHWRKNVYSKEWLLGQLFHYDLFRAYNPYGLGARSTEMVLKQMLSTAAANGMCNHVFANQLVQRQLFEAAAQRPATATPQATTKATARRATARGNDDEEEAREYGREVVEAAEDPWATLHETPGAQADLDADRFFNHYFLRDDGKPDRRKTKNGLRLDGLAAEASDAVVRRAERCGLYKCVTKEPPRRLCLGWNLEMVQQLAEHTDTKVRERRLQARTREETRLKEAHDELVARCHQRETGRTKEGVAQEWDIAGQYIILANELLDRCSPGGPLTLGISDKVKLSDVGPAQRAAFDFGVASGCMLLAASSPVMHWLLADAEKDHRRGSLAADGEGAPRNTSRKRKLPPTEAQLHRRRKRDTRTARSNQKNMNYELRLRGYEVVADGEKRIFYQPRSGHIRFRDETFTTFSGKINMGESFGVINIQGFKYSLEAPRKTPKWKDFSETAASLERAARAGHGTPATQCKKANALPSGKFNTPKSTAKPRHPYLKQKKD